jgi:peptide-methionine (R)-S-oxide reductase
MKRRQFITAAGGIALYSIFKPSIFKPAWADTMTTDTKIEIKPLTTDTKIEIKPLLKSTEEWQKLLSKESYAVLFEEATERGGTSPLNKEKRAGTFICAACFLPLFSSQAKYESGTGWPSFWQPIAAGHIGTKRDFFLILPRTEYHCARCGGHQGHVFKDGPEPTGLRYCNNGVALQFIPEGGKLPELRT